MLCPNCNQEVNESASFCSNCGSPLNVKTIQNPDIITEIPTQQVISTNDNVAGFNEQDKNNIANPYLQQESFQSIENQTNVFNKNEQNQQPFVANFNNQNFQPTSTPINTNVNMVVEQNPYNINSMQPNIPQPNPYQVQPNNQVEDKKDKKTILVIVGVIAALLLVCCCCLPAIGIAFSLNA